MIILAYDHRAYDLMIKVKKYLESKNLEYKEFASPTYTKTDSYAQFAKLANEEMLKDKNNMGIYSCRTGVGIAIAANRTKGVRAGLCKDVKTTFLARNDDDINVLVVPATTCFGKVKCMIDTFLNTQFEGGRHTERVAQLDA